VKAVAATFKEGDRVRIVDRDATAEDLKSGLYYNHFRGVTGTVQKMYATEVAVEVDQATLNEAVAVRHNEMQEQMKNKWLDSLSEEARNRLTPKERDFKLRYTVLVAVKDLQSA
jgi:ribosomal protein L21E